MQSRATFHVPWLLDRPPSTAFPTFESYRRINQPRPEERAPHPEARVPHLGRACPTWGARLEGLRASRRTATSEIEPAAILRDARRAKRRAELPSTKPDPAWALAQAGVQDQATFCGASAAERR